MSQKIKIVVIDETGQAKDANFFERIKTRSRDLWFSVKSKVMDFVGKVKSWAPTIIVYIPYIVEAVLALMVLAKPFLPNRRDKERDRIDHTYYDPSTGLHWRLKRKLTNRERIELERRRRDGESVGEILSDMNVLSR